MGQLAKCLVLDQTSLILVSQVAQGQDQSQMVNPSDHMTSHVQQGGESKMAFRSPVNTIPVCSLYLARETQFIVVTNVVVTKVNF